MLDLAARVPDCEVRGEAQHRVDRLVHPAEVSAPGDLCLLMSVGALGFLEADGSQHACAIVDRQLIDSNGSNDLLGGLQSYLVVDRPRYALACLSPLFRRQPQQAAGVHPSAVVEAGAVLGDGVSVGANAWIGDGARIGDGTTIMANVAICEAAVIGSGCWVFPGCLHRAPCRDRRSGHHPPQRRPRWRRLRLRIRRPQRCGGGAQGSRT